MLFHFHFGFSHVLLDSSLIVANFISLLSIVAQCLSGKQWIIIENQLNFIVKKSIESSNSGFLLCCLFIIRALLFHRYLVLPGSFDISIQRMSEVSIEFQCYDAFTF